MANAIVKDGYQSLKLSRQLEIGIGKTGCRRIAPTKNTHALSRKNDTAISRTRRTTNGRVGWAAKSHVPSNHGFPQNSECSKYRYKLVSDTAGIANHQRRKNQNGKPQAKYWNAQ